MNRAELIFLHGGPGYPDYLARFFQDCFPQHLGLTFYDQARGPGVDLKTLIVQLDEIVRQKTGDVFLVGHSWGGALALEYLARNSTKVKGLVLMDACIKKDHLFDEFIVEMKQRGIAENDIDSIFFTDAEKPLGRMLLEDINPRFDGELFAKFERDYLSNLDLSDVVGRMRMPALNIYGDCDVRIPARVLARLGDLNPRIESVEIQNAGHFPFLLESNRDLIVEAIVSFVG